MPGLSSEAPAAAGEVSRLEDAAVELEQRVAACTRDVALMRDQRERLLLAIGDSQRLIDEDVAKLDELRTHGPGRRARDGTGGPPSTRKSDPRCAPRRRCLRALAAEVDVQRATAESDLTHLAQQASTPSASRSPRFAKRSRGWRPGQVEPDVRAIRAAEAVEADESKSAGSRRSLRSRRPTRPAEAAQMTAEEAITELRGKIERIGPVDMMAIEQRRSSKSATAS